VRSREFPSCWNIKPIAGLPTQFEREIVQLSVTVRHLTGELLYESIVINH